MIKQIAIAVVLVLAIVVVVVALRVSRLYMNVPGLASYWQQRAEQPGEFVLVTIGDSTVQGLGAARPEESFVGRLATHVGEKKGQSVRVVNLSRSGATTQKVLENQVPNIAKYNPDLIVLAVGPNDITKGVSREDFMQNYRKILDKLPVNKTVIADIPNLTIRPGTKSEVLVRNRFIHDALFEKKLRLAPVHDTIEQHERDIRIYAADIYHPSSFGYSFWAQAFTPGVDEVLSTKPTP